MQIRSPNPYFPLQTCPLCISVWNGATFHIPHSHATKRSEHHHTNLELLCMYEYADRCPLLSLYSLFIYHKLARYVAMQTFHWRPYFKARRTPPLKSFANFIEPVGQWQQNIRKTFYKEKNTSRFSISGCLTHRLGTFTFREADRAKKRRGEKKGRNFLCKR